MKLSGVVAISTFVRIASIDQPQDHRPERGDIKHEKRGACAQASIRVRVRACLFIFVCVCVMKRTNALPQMVYYFFYNYIPPKDKQVTVKNQIKLK